MATAPLAGQIVRASDAFGLTAFNLNWTSFNPGTGPASEGYYQTIGRMVMWWFRVQLGTSPSGSGTYLLDLPVTAYTGGGNGLNACLGNWNYRVSGTVFYAGSMSVFASNGLQASFTLTSSTGRMNNTTPVSPAVDHVFSGGGVYLSS